MIVGGKKGAVIQNIKSAAGEGDWNRKVEPGDAVLEPEQKKPSFMSSLSGGTPFLIAPAMAAPG